MITLTDTHCHLGKEDYSREEIEFVVQQAQQAHVHRMITQGTNPENWERHLELARTYPGIIYPCCGIHPCDLEKARPDSLSHLRTLAESGVLAAIGETGLDYYWDPPAHISLDSYKKQQYQNLEAHFDLAAQTHLNLSLHVRDKEGAESFETALSLVKAYVGKVRTVFHCFIGTQEQAKQIFNYNGLISFTGISTFKNATQVLEVATWCPQGYFMLETDSPYLAPVPYRGQKNTPARVLTIAEKIAQSRGESLETLALHTEKTAQAFFKV